MNEQELLLEKIKGLIADSTKGVITEKALNEKVEAINAQLKTLNEKENNHEEVKKLKESVEKLLTSISDLAAEVKALKEIPGSKLSDKPKTFKEALMDAFSKTQKNVPSFIVEKDDTYGKHSSVNEYFSKMGHKWGPEMEIDFPVGSLTRKNAVDMTEAAIVGNYVSTIRLTELDPNRVGIPLTIYPHVTDWMPDRKSVV